jgi:hypothetical protein
MNKMTLEKGEEKILDFQAIEELKNHNPVGYALEVSAENTDLSRKITFSNWIEQMNQKYQDNEVLENHHYFFTPINEEQEYQWKLPGGEQVFIVQTA